MARFERQESFEEAQGQDQARANLFSDAYSITNEQQSQQTDNRGNDKQKGDKEPPWKPGDGPRDKDLPPHQKPTPDPSRKPLDANNESERLTNVKESAVKIETVQYQFAAGTTDGHAIGEKGPERPVEIPRRTEEKPKEEPKQPAKETDLDRKKREWEEITGRPYR